MEITQTQFINFITGNLPNSKEVPISHFCNIIENNLKITGDWIREYRHLVGSIKYDYRKLFNNLSEWQKSVIYFYFMGY